MTLYGRTPLDDEFVRSIISYYKGIRRTFDFKGVSTRREYWGFTFFHVFMVFMGILITGEFSRFQTIFEVLNYVGLISSISLTIRRLRDVGRSWRWVVPCYIPLLNFIVWVLFLVKPTPGWKPSQDEEYWWNPFTWKDGFFIGWW